MANPVAGKCRHCGAELFRSPRPPHEWTRRGYGGAKRARCDSAPDHLHHPED